jgi:hypothetical protein
VPDVVSVAIREEAVGSPQTKKDACTGEGMRLRSSRLRLSRPREREMLSVG